MIEMVIEGKKEVERWHYVPHLAVIKLVNNTTKVYVVYDASTKSKKSKFSLNECLHKGPVILVEMCELFIRFWTRRIRIVADSEKAFLQIRL